MRLLKTFLPVLILLTLTGYDLNAANKPSDISLYEAVKTSNISELKKLIAGGADINQFLLESYSEGNQPTALLFAVANRDMPLVKFLLANGADIEARNNLNMTAVGIAVWINDFAMVKFLVEKGANIHVTRRDKPSDSRSYGDYAEEPLHWAFINGNVKLAQYLLDKGARIKTDKAGNGEAALLAGAILSDNVEAVKLLINRGVDLNLPSKEFRGIIDLPIFEAIKGENPQILKVLVDNGALTEVKNRDGKSPKQIIESKIQKYEEMVKILK